MNWQDKKRIGEALGYRVVDENGGHVIVQDLTPKTGICVSEESAWTQCRIWIIEEVIPWLQKNAEGLMFNEYHGAWNAWALSPPEMLDHNREFPTFSEAVCALMLDILDAEGSA